MFVCDKGLNMDDEDCKKYFEQEPEYDGKEY